MLVVYSICNTWSQSKLGKCGPDEHQSNIRLAVLGAIGAHDTKISKLPFNIKVCITIKGSQYKVGDVLPILGHNLVKRQEFMRPGTDKHL